MASAHAQTSKKAKDGQKAFEGHWVQFTPAIHPNRVFPLSQGKDSFDISFADNGEAVAIQHHGQIMPSGQWGEEPPAKYRGRLVNDELVVNADPLIRELKRELRFRRTQQGLSLTITYIQSVNPGSEWTIKFNVRRKRE